MRSLYSLFFILFIIACSSGNQGGEQVADEIVDENPPCEGFNMTDSDPEAIALADEVMKAMGGRKAWDNTRYIKWSFFGRRDLLWDKLTGQVRIDSPRDTMTYLLNINSMEGSVYKKGEPITEEEELKNMLERGKSIWINDSYWLVMPFKLKDTGLAIKYLRSDTTMTGAEADVIQLTFADVGRTPDNKYEVWIDKSDKLIKQWAYFRQASQDTATNVWPFDNYQKHGEILLSADRSDDRGPRDVQVFSEIDSTFFTDPKPMDL